MVHNDRIFERSFPEIVERWAVDAQKAASARGLSRPELRNLMPRLLDVLATADHEEEELSAYLESHLAARIRQGFDLVEMLHEFTIVERVSASVWDRLPRSERPSPEQRTRITSALQRCVVLVTAMFQEHMQHDEQQEKRYLRELQSIAYDALRTPAGAEQALLKDMLEVAE